MPTDAAPGDEPGKPELLTGWGRTAPSRGNVLCPTTALEVSRRVCAANPRGIIARGLGRSYGDSAQNAGGTVIDTSAFWQIRSVDLESGQVTAGAGLSLDTLTRVLLPFGLFVAVTPGTRFVTLGGAIASDIHGKNHHVDGSFCRHVVSFELVTPDGRKLTASPEQNAEIFWATAGGMGLTGVIVEVTLKLTRVETSWISVDTERAPDLDDLMQRMAARDNEYRYSVAWIDCLARGSRLGRAVLTRGDHAPRTQLLPRQRDNPLKFSPPERLRAPRWFPSGLLNSVTVGAFNELFFRKAPRVKTGALEPLHSFFHPLDGIADWNRMYGKNGFLQYQFVVPFGCEETVRGVVEHLATARCPSFLGVLKRFGQGNGLLSFPIPGWTLAIDIPAALPGLAGLLDELDTTVAEAGGRVYLSKDSRLRPELLEVMYPELGSWREVREGLDPQGIMCSDLARRLELV